ncbi:MAG: segregation and condensation protein A [Kineosporiaceae bacterium]
MALAAVTDEFIRHLRAAPALDLDEASGFVVVAATLLDLKAARLLPGAEVDDEQDLAALEARDLLFARLLQYRAYRQAADHLADRLAAHAGRVPRSPGADPVLAPAMPELVWTLSADDFVRLAAEALRPRPAAEVATGHLHAPVVAVGDQRRLLLDRLTPGTSLTFAALLAGAGDTSTVVARFLALLDLYRDGVLTVTQDGPLGEIVVRRPREEGS